ncbi:MAG TPA: LysR family transcriptional regulator [Solirubrobacteraceae bacterium]|nr:LysR family transcriptional regulator [Solirubrobacteraceae bacterium]
MELRQLRYFVAVAEELHFRRAAARLHISQPPLSQQIARLESELGVTLLRRTRRRVELTAAGAAFLRDAHRLIAELDTAVATAQRLGQGAEGRLRVGFVGSALFSTLPAAVQRFRRERPGVEVELRERSTAEQLRTLETGAIDVGLVRPPIEAGDRVRVHAVLREHTVLALPDGHRLAAMRRIPLRRLGGEPLVLFPRAQAPGFHDLLMSRLAEGGEPPVVAQYAPEMLTIVGLVAAGVGVSPVPASVQHLALDGVAYRPLSGAPDTELVAITRAAEESPLVAAFLAHAQG